MEAIYNYNDRGNLVNKITLFGKGEYTNTVMEYDDKDRVIRQVVYNYDFFNKKNKDIEDETIIIYENDKIVSILNSEALHLREYNKDIETDRFGTINFDFVQTNKIEDKINSIYCETERNGIYHIDEENIDVEYDKISYNIDYCDNDIIIQSLVLSKEDFTVYLENSYNGEKKNYRITKYNDDKLLESDISVDIVSNQKRNYSCKNKYIVSLDELDDNDIDVKIDNNDIIEDESIDVKSIENMYCIKYMTDNETEKRDIIAESTIKGFDKTDNSYFILHKTNNNNETFGRIEQRYDIHNRLIQSNVNNIFSIYEYQSDTDNRIKTHTSIGGLRKVIKTNDGVKLTNENKKKEIYLYNEFNDKLITVKYSINYFDNFCSKYIKITDKDSRVYYESNKTSNDNPTIINEVLALDK